MEGPELVGAERLLSRRFSWADPRAASKAPRHLLARARRKLHPTIQGFDLDPRGLPIETGRLQRHQIGLKPVRGRQQIPHLGLSVESVAERLEFVLVVEG